MSGPRSLEYALRAAEQRLRGIRAQLEDHWTFAGISDRHDAEQEIERLQRAIKADQSARDQKLYAAWLSLAGSKEVEHG